MSRRSSEGQRVRLSGVSARSDNSVDIVASNRAPAGHRTPRGSTRQERVVDSKRAPARCEDAIDGSRATCSRRSDFVWSSERRRTLAVAGPDRLATGRLYLAQVSDPNNYYSTWAGMRFGGPDCPGRNGRSGRPKRPAKTADRRSISAGPYLHTQHDTKQLEPLYVSVFYYDCFGDCCDAKQAPSTVKQSATVET